MGQMSRDPEVYWLAAGKQLGRERAAIALMGAAPIEDAEKIYVPAGCHPRFGEGLKLGYQEGIAARDPMAAAMGGNE